MYFLLPRPSRPAGGSGCAGCGGSPAGRQSVTWKLPPAAALPRTMTATPARVQAGAVEFDRVCGDRALKRVAADVSVLDFSGWMCQGLVVPLLSSREWPSNSGALQMWCNMITMPHRHTATTAVVTQPMRASVPRGIL